MSGIVIVNDGLRRSCNTGCVSNPHADGVDQIGYSLISRWWAGQKPNVKAAADLINRPITSLHTRQRAQVMAHAWLSSPLLLIGGK